MSDSPTSDLSSGDRLDRFLQHHSPIQKVVTGSRSETEPHSWNVVEGESSRYELLRPHAPICTQYERTVTHPDPALPGAINARLSGLTAQNLVLTHACAASTPQVTPDIHSAPSMKVDPSWAFAYGQVRRKIPSPLDDCAAQATHVTQATQTAKTSSSTDAVFEPSQYYNPVSQEHSPSYHSYGEVSYMTPEMFADISKSCSRL